MTSASQVLNLAAALATRVLMARFLGPAGYGGFGVALNLVTVLSKVLAFGTVPAVQYYASKVQESRRDFLRTVIAIGVVLGVALTAIAMLLPFGFPDYFARQPVAASVHPFLSAGVLAIVLGSLLGSLLIPWGRIFAYTVIQLVPGAFILFLFAFFAAVTGPLNAAVTGYLVAWFGGLGYTLWVLRTEMAGGAFRWSEVRRVLRYGLIVWPNVVLSVGGARVAVLLGAGFVTEAGIGMFVVALNLVEGVFAFHAPLGQLLFTRVSEQEAGSFAVAQESMRMSVFILLLVGLAFVAAGRPVLLLLFGREFAASWHLSLVLLVTGLCHSLTRVLNNFQAGMGRPGRNTVTLAVETGLLLALVPLLAGGGKVTGVAFASVISSSTALLVATFQTCQIMECSPVALYVPRRADLARLRRRVRAVSDSSASSLKDWIDL